MTPTEKIKSHIENLPQTESLAELQSQLLPLLHKIQDDIGHIPSDCYPLIAKALFLSEAEIHGVITFYHHFRTQAKGKHLLQICRAESCQAMGAKEIETFVKEKLQVDYHQTTIDGKISLEPIYCLGACACSPAIMWDDELLGKVDREKLNSLIEDA